MVNRSNRTKGFIKKVLSQRWWFTYGIDLCFVLLGIRFALEGKLYYVALCVFFEVFSWGFSILRSLKDDHQDE